MVLIRSEDEFPPLRSPPSFPLRPGKAFDCLLFLLVQPRLAPRSVFKAFIVDGADVLGDDDCVDVDVSARGIGLAGAGEREVVVGMFLRAYCRDVVDKHLWAGRLEQ